MLAEKILAISRRRIHYDNAHKPVPPSKVLADRVQQTTWSTR